MAQVLIERWGNAQSLKYSEAYYAQDVLLDHVAPHEIVVQVHFSGINFADIMMRKGLYPDAPKKPFIPGYEVAGIVLKVGAEVRDHQIGDEVVVGTLFSGYQSCVKVHEDLVFKKPATLTLAQGAALPVNWLTASIALQDMARVRDGDHILLDNATGGVGTMALQILQHFKVHVIGLTSSPSKFDYIKQWGATPMLHADFFKQQSSLKFDVILNSTGGKSFSQHYECLNFSGRIVGYGVSSVATHSAQGMFSLIPLLFTMPRFSLLKMFDKNKGIFALNVLRYLENAEYRNNLKNKWPEVQHWNLQPHVDKIFPAREVALAHDYLEQKKAKGKVLLSWV